MEIPSTPMLIVFATTLMIIGCVLLSMIGYTLDKILDLLREWFRAWTNK